MANKPAMKKLLKKKERPEIVTVWCALWPEGGIGGDTAQEVSKSGQKLSQKNQ